MDGYFKTYAYKKGSKMTKLDRSFKKRRYLILIPLLIILAGSLIWGISWATYARPPLPEALAALESDDLVAVAEEPWLTFTPTGEIKAGLIYYPGGGSIPAGIPI